MKKVYARERTLKRADGGACGIGYIRQNVDAERTKNKGRAAKKKWRTLPCTTKKCKSRKINKRKNTRAHRWPDLKFCFVGFDKQHLVEVKRISTHDGVLIAGGEQMLFERVGI